MKSQLESCSEYEPFSFPILMINKTHNFIVLFDSEISGTVVFSREKERLGEYCDYWISAFDKNEWSEYEGKIILEN